MFLLSPCIVSHNDAIFNPEKKKKNKKKFPVWLDGIGQHPVADACPKKRDDASLKKTKQKQPQKKFHTHIIFLLPLGTFTEDRPSPMCPFHFSFSFCERNETQRELGRKLPKKIDRETFSFPTPKKESNNHQRGGGGRKNRLQCLTKETRMLECFQHFHTHARERRGGSIDNSFFFSTNHLTS
jgi:hypothetical protein